tara:strand:- start:323 stop:805 length:483 start_codon:yes stop_codon:yes gene_type:complete
LAWYGNIIESVGLKMSYRDSSNQSGDISERFVSLEIIRRGWHVLEPISRDAVYDLVADIDGTFQTIQVKTMCGNSIAKIVDRSGEVVAKNGKTRNSIDYAEHGIDWLVGYDKHNQQCYFYKLENYSKIPSKSFSVNKYKPDKFPTRPVENRHTKKEICQN